MLRNILAGAMLLLVLSGTLLRSEASAADTLRVTMPRAEQLFTERNLVLIAQHYNIDAGKAFVLQARLWDNPILNTDQNLYAGHRWLEHSRNPDGTYNGQYYLQVQQLIRTAGKRGRLIDMASTNAEIAEWQFRDLLRNLKYQLRNDLYSTYHLYHAGQLYRDELQQLDKLLEGMTAQLQAGNIARKDLLRVQALQISTQQEAAQNSKDLLDVQAELKTLLDIGGDTVVVPDLPDEPAVAVLPVLEQLQAAGRENNAAYHLQQLQLQYQQHNLAYQKAMAVPDLTLGPSFDKNNSYTPNYVGLGISVPLPVFNRNQGNIRAAKSYVSQGSVLLKEADLTLQNDITAAYGKFLVAQQLNSAASTDFYNSYGKLYQNIVESYRQRQISLIEFIDYFEAYKDTRLKQLQAQQGLSQAREELNYEAGSDVLH